MILLGSSVEGGHPSGGAAVLLSPSSKIFFTFPFRKETAYRLGLKSQFPDFRQLEMETLIYR